MQVVILAGGLGTRLKSVAKDTPKALVPVAGRPFIEHQFELLQRNALKDILLCVGFMGDRIEKHVGDGSKFGMRVKYSYEDPAMLLGTGGALLNALPKLAPSFFVMYGDSYLPTDYQAALRAFETDGKKAMMCVFRNEGKWDQSNVRVEGERVVFYSKAARQGEADYIDYGLSVYDRSVVQAYAGVTLPLDLGNMQADLVRRGEMWAFEVHQRFYEIGKPEGLEELDRLLRGGR
jgi:N-acetyl-alpha-D-muramate 1-phosphate uridylyltransferase